MDLVLWIPALVAFAILSARYGVDTRDLRN